MASVLRLIVALVVVFDTACAFRGPDVRAYLSSQRQHSGSALSGYTRKLDGGGGKEARPQKKPVQAGKKSPAPSAKPAAKGDSLEQLELQVLSKYGSNAFREALEEGWEDDEDDEPKPKKRSSPPQGPLAQYGTTGRFQGFGATASGGEGPKTGQFVDETEAKFYRGLKTLRPPSRGAAAAGDDTKDKDEDEDEDDEEEEEEEEAEAKPVMKRTTTLLGGRLGRRLAPASSPGSTAPPTSDAAAATTGKRREKDDTVGALLAELEAYEGEEAGEEEGPRRKKERWARGDKLLQQQQPEEEDEAQGQQEEEGGPRYKTNNPRSSAAAAAQPAAPTFRLRPPPPKSAAELEKEAAAAARIVADEELRKRKRQERKERERTEFLPFDFTSDAASSASASASASIGAEADQVFSASSFEDLGVTDEVVLTNLAKMKMFNPTRIQEKAVPTLLQGQDALIHAQTGSGKTLAFLLPLLSVIDPKRSKVQCIILAPSRELVTQIGQVAERLFAGTDIRTVTIIGGANARGQVDRLREERPQIIVASPGRLAELVFRLEKLRLGNVRAVIIDEVDNMMQESYRGDVEVLLEATAVGKSRARARDGGDQGIPSSSSSSSSSASSAGQGYELEAAEAEALKVIPGIEEEEDEDEEEGAGTGGATQAGEKQKTTADDSASFKGKQFICLASATGTSPSVSAFASRFCREWKKVAVDASSPLPRTITHGLISTPRMRALEQLRKLLAAKPAVQSALIFVNDPYRVEIITEQLLEMGLVAAPLHGDSSKDDRKEILSRLRDGRLRLVVCTELAARGLDIPDLSHVINFELPTDAAHYVHRAGRCGRAAKKGLVINFANPDTKFVVRRFGKQLGVKVRDCEIRDGQVFLKSA